MTVMIRRSDERGRFDHGWLGTRHSFSFASYHDPEWMGFRVLRVLNEDRVKPGTGFGPHSHRDMEILTYVLEGALRHEDSEGNAGVIRPGEVQRMCAGTGVTHSEWNASDAQEVHFLQVWILPRRRGLEPAYAHRAFGLDVQGGGLVTVAAPPGTHVQALPLEQDARVLAGRLGPGARVRHSLAPGRHAWVQVARGSLRLGGGTDLVRGDGAGLSDEGEVALEAGPEGAEALVFDLP